ncbi:ribosome maturation factor RimM [Geobacter sp. SVR]|uniref:ribosome maturation factor RimM n=1 Tax=Geobacter sp. SVR TaxID=2495594 RepID=UPI00143EFBF7|nr:ribosome maturation factor RimM [Geobacter sp. SVR]BCS53167.1 ribosome maturation factor RimM [Geobacter sp. SVR]GCF84552.1 ribosome maturation factor RimM [Geobacter sp. SVR]
MPAPDTLVPVGKIIGTHGIRGLLKVFSFSGNMESLNAAGTITLKSSDGSLQKHAVASLVAHGGKFLIGLKGFENINQVLHLVGSEICLLRSQLPETEEDEYYWCDLIGLSVATVDGIELGTISDIFESGASDIYVVTGKDREYLIPAIADVISSVDLADGRMLITPLEGLLDL